MKLKPLVVCALLAASASSFAAGGSLGVLDSTVVVGNPAVAAPFFFDTYTFTLDTVSDVFGGVYSFGISGFTAVLQDASFTTVGTDSSLGDGFSFEGLSAGDYALSFLGFSEVGAYGGVVTATPVPEPETYALLLAGLGMVVFMIKRRGSA
ncbi:MAG: PEP-CTERM sorting domain-containing protein [Rubrivivax sp.]|nr:PEP-CTERM sorting domain-containing protein [Rubrivivax sp.]